MIAVLFHSINCYDSLHSSDILVMEIILVLVFIYIILFYQNLRLPAIGRFGIECPPYTKSRINQIPCVCM